MKLLAASAPRLDIFSSAFVNRQMDGCRITNAGREFLTKLEMPIRVTSDSELPLRDDAGVAPLKPVPKLRLVVDNTGAVANSADPDKLSA